MARVAYLNALAAPVAPGACTGCGLHSWCLPANLNLRETGEIERVTEHRRSIRRHHFLFHAGDALQSLYIIHSGSVKTIIADANGHVQVTGFSLPGDVVGIEAIDSGRYPCDVIATEDSSCCGVRYADLNRLSRGIPALQAHVLRMMSREITRDYGLMFLLGSMPAEERVAQFLVSLSLRYAARGYSATCFTLCMSRMDISSYLGLRLETLSRVLARLHDRRILDVAGREISLTNPAVLRQMLGELGTPVPLTSTRH